MTLEEIKREALTALALGKFPHSQRHLSDGRLLFVKAHDKWTFDYILDGDHVPEIEVVDAIKAEPATVGH